MLKVGLTGGIASGKSTVSTILEELGGHVIDSDTITHELLGPGQQVSEAVVREFGDGIVGQDGRIDRRLLGAIVFDDPRRRAVLNALIHPEVARRQEEFLARVAREDPRGVAIVDASLMIETGSYTRYERIVVVSCPEHEQRRRLRDRGLSADQIDARLRAQMPLADKVRYADYVIDNSGSIDDTRRQVREVWDELSLLAALGSRSPE